MSLKIIDITKQDLININKTFTKIYKEFPKAQDADIRQALEKAFRAGINIHNLIDKTLWNLQY